MLNTPSIISHIRLYFKDSRYVCDKENYLADLLQWEITMERFDKADDRFD